MSELTLNQYRKELKKLGQYVRYYENDYLSIFIILSYIIIPILLGFLSSYFELNVDITKYIANILKIDSILSVFKVSKGYFEIIQSTIVGGIFAIPIIYLPRLNHYVGIDKKGNFILRNYFKKISFPLHSLGRTETIQSKVKSTKQVTTGWTK
ncbi:hypothetical protein [Helicobacter cetorum]|uniref:Uncharacterized protein n=1 Tax=Helicobacter cetorum (strain ATCC BAA-429 / MIT 00-7128) TaxID=182217 RepID=I0EKQ8_HELC0|nr:hypothetical protein [Helicobacter cetorum]AFI03527.1 hypothetical protein HCW_01180 [Helicobacter cetorum MIT 00-7128]